MIDALDRMGDIVMKVATFIEHQHDKAAVNWARRSYLSGAAPQSHYVNACIRYYLKWEKYNETN